MQNRIGKLVKLLNANNCDGVIITKPENLYYFSGFNGSTGYLLVDKNGDVRLAVDGRYINQAQEQAKSAKVVEFDLTSPLIRVKEQVEYFNWQVIAMEGSFQSYSSWFEIASYINNEQHKLDFVNLDLSAIRMVKDEGEINNIRIAAQIACDALEKTLASIKAGVREIDVAAELEYNMKKLGSQQQAFATILASGERSALPHGRASEKIISKGDFVVIDFGAMYNGYCSDMTRTVVVGKASQRHKEIYDTVLAAQLAGLAAATPGKIGCEIDSAARDVIERAGYGQYFRHGLGHSVGLEIHESPRLSQLNKTVAFATGMLATIEPGIYIPGFGGVRIEDLIVIRDKEPENLTSFTKELLEL